MAVVQWHLQQLGTVGLPLHWMSFGIPAIELANEANPLRARRLADKINWLPHFLSGITGTGKIRAGSFHEPILLRLADLLINYELH
jgi:hypothetical protein